MMLRAAPTVIRTLDTSQVKSLGILSIVAIVLVGLLIARFVTTIVTRVIVLALVVALAVAVYQQRATVLNAADNAARNCDATFFGIHVQPSDPTVKKACAAVAKRKP